MKKLGLLFFSCLFLLAFEANAQSLSANVNRSELPQGETLLLTIDLEGGKDGDKKPDFSVLDKDFKIYSVSSSFNSNYSTDGGSSTNRQWQVVLAPLKTGGLMIPSIKLGSLKTKPVPLKVIDAEDSPELAKFSVKAEIDNLSPYVQQQINYTLVIKDSGGLQGSAPQIIDNGSNEWIVRVLRQPTIENFVNGSSTYREIKFYYALFPQKSGKLKAPTIRFDGYYAVKNPVQTKQVDSMFSRMFSVMSTAPVILTPKEVEIDVKPALSSIWWLPAKDVKISAAFDKIDPVFKVGEAISRTITLRVEGVLENQLPELNLPKVDGLKQYPEKTSTENAVENDAAIAVKKFPVVYIPSRGGRLVLPEVAVEWFDVKTSELKKAVLPAFEIEVEGSTVAEVVSEPKPVSPVSEPAKVIVEKEKSMMPYLGILAAFVLGILVSYLLFAPRNQAKRNLKKAVVAAARRGNIRILRDELLGWGEVRFRGEKINNLKDLAKLVKSKEFEREMELIMNALYSNKAARFDFDNFVKVFEKVSKKRITKSKESVLPELY